MLETASAVCLALMICPFAAAQPAASITGKDGVKMVLVPAGPFMMGSGQGNPDETPPHTRDLPAFYIDMTEVTIGQYARYVKETGARPPPSWVDAAPPAGREAYPVIQVTWSDAMRYAAWAGKRLPTEAEWEKAARGTDGRMFPWGNDPCEACANLGGEKICPVGQFPRSVSPFGAQDMAGNVWEWTADWYQPYPGTNARLVHFGHRYKVMRGSGAAYFYTLIENQGRCALRGRILPYAAEDYLGFRCAQDVDPGRPAYDPAKLLAEADEQLKGSLPKPVALAYEGEYDNYLKAGRVPIQITGQTGQGGYVRGGIPLPQGRLKDLKKLCVLGGDGMPRPLQARTLTSWRDGSARWVLLDFPATAGEHLQLSVIGGTTVASARALKISEVGDTINIDTSLATYSFTRDALLRGVSVGGQPVISGSTLSLVLDRGPLRMLPAETVKWEDKGPLHATLRLTGWFADAAGNKTPMQYDLRAHLVAGSTRANLLLTLSHLQPRKGPEADRQPMAKIVDASWHFTTAAPAGQAAFGGDLGIVTGSAGASSELLQPDATHYAITRDRKEISKGTKARGWVAVETGGTWLSVGLRHFWQNFAKALTVKPNETIVRLWAGKEPLEFEATIAKTHEIVIEVLRGPPSENKHCELEPLRLSVAPAWACGTQALGGPMLPRGPEMIAQMPYWVLAREHGMRQWMRAMEYGWRDFGDTRHYGDAKGANAAHNLEYDIPFNFLIQYLGTGETWYLDAAEFQCRHQGDIDTDNVTGQPYKHAPLHTTWYAEIAHMFLRGLVVHYWCTGEERSLEMARKIADHIAPQAEAFRGFGNERQIGWGLYALTGIYEATLDEKYLRAANKLCDTLIAGMSPTGKFKIRWDNRMSLMNGMAMNGMMSVQELNDSGKLADALMRLSTRTLGFYPEYALRTLQGYAWALTRTNDPRFLDVLARTWESCLELQVKRCDASAEEVHAWRFPWFNVKYRLHSVFDKPPAVLPDAASWKGAWLPGAAGEIFVRTRGTGPGPVLLINHGMAPGRVERFDSNGRVAQSVDLKGDRLYTPAALALPASGATYRVRFDSPEGIGWELHHDARSAVTFYDPQAERLSELYPKAFCYLKPGAKEVRILFEAVGEGSHQIALMNPAGNIVGEAGKFIPFEDKGRYEVELKLPVSDLKHEIWSLEAFHAKVLKIEGFLPYWSTAPDELFNPEMSSRDGSAIAERKP